jgi:hypothetical protein
MPDTAAPIRETYQSGTTAVSVYAAEAAKLRPLFMEASQAGILSTRKKLEALAAARPFLILARRNRADFQDEAKRVRGIKAGRLETRVIRYLHDVDVRDSRTSAGRWADALEWLTERCVGVSDAEAVEAAIRAGGETKIAEIQRRGRAAKRSAMSAVLPAPTFLEGALRMLDEYEPDDSPPEPNTISVRIEVIDPAGTPRLYARLPVESLIRSAITTMRAITPKGC